MARFQELAAERQWTSRYGKSRYLRLSEAPDGCDRLVPSPNRSVSNTPERVHYRWSPNPIVDRLPREGYAQTQQWVYSNRDSSRRLRATRAARRRADPNHRPEGLAR